MSKPINEYRRATLTPGKSLKILREWAEMTQTELSELSGVPQAAISKIESGNLAMGAARARKLGDAMCCHPGALLFADWNDEDAA